MSAWSDFANSVAELGTAGVNAYNTVKNGNAPAPAAAPTSTQPNWLLVGGIGAAVVVILLVVMNRK